MLRGSRRAPVELSWLAQRAEPYTDAPAGVAVITAGIDTQDDRIELELVGWGLGDESWSIAYEVIYGDPAGATLWQELDELLRQKIRHESGRMHDPPLHPRRRAEGLGPAGLRRRCRPLRRTERGRNIFRKLERKPLETGEITHEGTAG